MSNISCVIVSYNNGVFLQDAIMSVVNQTMKVTEIIVADDGSTDDSRNLITSLAHKYPQIQPVFREKNIGVATNRDLAIRAAKSNLVTTLDGDDLYLPQKIEREFLALQNNHEPVAYSDVYLASNKNEESFCLTLSELSQFDRKQRLRWMVNNVVKLPRDMLLTKKLYLAVGGMKHELKRYEDWEFKIRLAASPNQWVHSGIVGSNYRQTSSGLSKINLLKHIQDQSRVLTENQYVLKEHLGEQEYWLAIARIFIRAGRSIFGIRSKFKKLDNFMSNIGSE